MDLLILIGLWMGPFIIAGLLMSDDPDYDGIEHYLLFPALGWMILPLVFKHVYKRHKVSRGKCTFTHNYVHIYDFESRTRPVTSKIMGQETYQCSKCGYVKVVRLKM